MSGLIPPPPPFLGPVFRAGVEPRVIGGWRYEKDDRDRYGVNHNAIDLAVPRGTEVLAPTDGYYLCTYGETLLVNDEGRPKLLSLEEARRNNPSIDLSAPDDSGGPWPVWYGSFLVQGSHPATSEQPERLTQCAHLDRVSDVIPYHRPSITTNGDLAYSPALRWPVERYQDAAVAVYLEAGTPIGMSGMTGCGWGRPNYVDVVPMPEADRPSFLDVDYTYYTEPHLHLVVGSHRRDDNRDVDTLWDPFGAYAEAGSEYPEHRSQWPGWRPGSLWLPGA